MLFRDTFHKTWVWHKYDDKGVFIMT